jgi:hypothetical protein
MIFFVKGSAFLTKIMDRRPVLFTTKEETTAPNECFQDIGVFVDVSSRTLNFYWCCDSSSSTIDIL